jgi:hypothetical protein
LVRELTMRAISTTKTAIGITKDYFEKIPPREPIH